MSVYASTAQALLTGYDTALSRQWREEERLWRQADLEWREHERSALVHEAGFMEQEARHRDIQVQQLHLDNARILWSRYIERNRQDVLEKVEQLKAVASIAAIVAGFALVAFLEFDFKLTDSIKRVVPLFGLTTAVTVGLEMGAVVLCSLMLASILRTGKKYVSEEEEAEFMHKCAAFLASYKLGDRPPRPQRSFSVHWAQKCEKEWRTAFRLFAAGIPFFFANLAIAAWMKFPGSTAAAVLVTVVMGCSLLLNLYTHSRWGDHLLMPEARGSLHDAGALALTPAGLPFDWHLPPAPLGQQQHAVHEPSDYSNSFSDRLDDVPSTSDANHMPGAGAPGV